MVNDSAKIKKLKQSFSWNFIFFILDDLYNHWNFDDEKYNKLFDDLLRYVETKIAPPDNSGDVVDRYVIVEYESPKQ